MPSITKVKFQSICLQIEATKYFKSFVAFWISYLHHDLETALKTGPFNFSTLSYSTINFANGLHDFISSRYALKSLRFAQEQRVSCKPICPSSHASLQMQLFPSRHQIKSSYQTPLNLYQTVSQVVFQSIASIAAFSTILK